jgi:hypothetical protein
VVQIADGRELHPQRGPHRPHTGTPARRPNSIRRTTTHTLYHPEGLIGPVKIEGRGRDLWTGRSRETRVVATAAVEADIDFVGTRTLTALTVHPHLDATPLVGVRVTGGFRKALETGWPDEDRTSLRFQLLDELAVAQILCGYPLSAAGLHPPRGSVDMSRQADVCAGWVQGGTILLENERLGHVPLVTGPVVPAPEESEPDELGWHDHGCLEPHGMQRRRRIDVWQRAPGDLLEVEDYFRDSHMSEAGLETVVHEYVVRAEIEPATSLIRSCRADIGVLPWMECPGALASAGRVVGLPAAELRRYVRENFSGTSTCTHLNDALRALAAVPFLAGVVMAGPSRDRYRVDKTARGSTSGPGCTL